MNTNKVIFGQYIDKNSIIHSLDPRIKLMGTLFFAIGVLSINNVLGYLYYAVLLACLIILSKISFYDIFKSYRGVLFVLFFSFVYHVFFVSGEDILFRIGPLCIYKIGVLSGIIMIIKIIMLITMATILTHTTKPLDIALGIEVILNPLKRIGCPVQDFSLMICMTLRFIPTLLNEVNSIRQAQLARNVDIVKGNIIERIYNYSRILIPLLLICIQKCENLSLAIEARAYKCGIERVSYKKLQLKKTDYVSIVLVMICFILLMIIYNIG